jgi:hypothetical protein
METRIWTEYEVRRRLEDYHMPDDLYYCQAVRFSAMKIGYSSGDDGMPSKMAKLLERAKLYYAVMSLYPKGKKILTDEQNERRFLCYLIQMRYISEPRFRISDIRNITGRPWQSLKDKETEAISLITGFLNGEKQMDNESVKVVSI